MAEAISHTQSEPGDCRKPLVACIVPLLLAGTLRGEGVVPYGIARDGLSAGGVAGVAGAGSAAGAGAGSGAVGSSGPGATQAGTPIGFFHASRAQGPRRA